MHEGSRKAIIAAFLANFGIAVAKFVGYAFTGAASMLAEAVHSVADTTNQGLLLLGTWRARRKATREHQFGYARERFFWAFVVALVIFSLGSLFALLEGFEKLAHPHEIESTEWAIGILAVAIVLEAFSLRTAVREASPVKGEDGWWSYIRHSKVPELPVVLLEDVGALVGLVFALAGVTLAFVTGNSRWDALGSLAIGALLGVIATILIIEMKSLLIGDAASPTVERAIRAAIESHPCVKRLIHMRTQHLGPEDICLGAKVELDERLNVAQAAHEIDDIERAIRREVPNVRVIYVEPDVFKGA
jgi:cation diffusion facilitator family transporter